MGELQQHLNNICVGLLAHVDAGKTTLTEGLLYCGGAIKKQGRVDHKNAFLDTDALEKERGITILSKQAILPLRDKTITFVDTPGHVDFSAEMERALQIMDYAILVISATDGVQAHTETLWQLLERHRVPTFLFINKMDLAGADSDVVLEELRRRLHENCLPISKPYSEELAMCSEALMEEYLQGNGLSTSTLATAVSERRLFPCCFGSALRMDGVEEFLRALERYLQPKDYSHDFSALVYKITRDTQGKRLTWMKITGGTLYPKMVLHGRDRQGSEDWSEKADQLRLYSGAKFTPIDSAPAGTLVAVTGLTKTYAGEGLGEQSDAPQPMLEGVITCRLLLPDDCDAQALYPRLKELEEEDPLLRIVWNVRQRAIFVRLMGQVQQEVLRRRILERYGVKTDFGAGQVVYKETITEPIEGVGHFEPLRHFAEVRLLLAPGERGSGIVLECVCSEALLDGHWQRLILSHIAEREHLGVLTGAPITDLKITLLSGRSHVKHTEGGDFREATYRAVRMGLMRAKSVLLEPWYQLRLELPDECLGRAISDLQRFGGEFETPQAENHGLSVLCGAAPVSSLMDYAAEVAVYTRGRGRLSLRTGGYRACPNQDEIVEKIAYRAEADVENTPDSVFCAHGSGVVVKWNQVEEKMHLPWAWHPQREEEERQTVIHRSRVVYSGSRLEDRQLEAIYTHTYGAQRERAFVPQSELKHPDAQQVAQYYGAEETFLLVDGYNVIFAWDELSRLAKTDLDAARNRLVEILCNYQGFKRCPVILVYDAYKIKGAVEHMERVNNIFVVYTKQAERADTYIERTTYDLGKRYRIRVVTSDGMEQRIILGHNAQRISSRLFLLEVEEVERQIRRAIAENNARQL